MIYRCNVCNSFEYDSNEGEEENNIPKGAEPYDLPDTWICPICGSDRSHLQPVIEKRKEIHTGFTCPVCGTTSQVATPPALPNRVTEALLNRMEAPLFVEEYLADIHQMAETGRSVIEPMRTTKQVITWDELLICGAQIARIPINADVPVLTRTVIGPRAAQPLVIDTPVYVTHMSFGALSKETKIALARGSARVRTAIGSGEGGVLPEEQAHAYRYIFEYVPNQYSLTAEMLRSVDAIEIKLGQSAEPGLGARLPGEKVTPEIAAVRGYPAGVDIISPARFTDIRTRDDLKAKVTWLREISGGRPVGVKIAAGHIEADLEAIVSAGADFVTIDGRPGGTGAAPKIIKASTSVPTIFALYRARETLDRLGATGTSLVITGGLRVSSDIAKALALGADAVALGTAALMACGCHQHRICSTGRCPEGLTTQDMDLRTRMNSEVGADRLANFLNVTTAELEDFTRLTGHTDVHDLNRDDLVTTSATIAAFTDLRHV
jgi:glutamate synthase domain-containing protein 2